MQLAHRAACHRLAHGAAQVGQAANIDVKHMGHDAILRGSILQRHPSRMLAAGAIAEGPLSAAQQLTVLVENVGMTKNDP